MGRDSIYINVHWKNTPFGFFLYTYTVYTCMRMMLVHFLQDILDMCGNKHVVFDNRTKNKVKKDEQRNQLLKLIEEVLDRNGGKPYTSDLFHEMKVSDCSWFRLCCNFLNIL